MRKKSMISRCNSQAVSIRFSFYIANLLLSGILFFASVSYGEAGDVGEENVVRRGLTVLDWSVLIVYLTTMILVGWHFSRRTKTTEDYLLGGRRMKSWTVGLSLFASLLSTISYLATPGEMIRYGPLYLGGILSYPLIIFVVGWGLIPFIMRSQVTSAYELLEERLGLAPRLLGALFFLSMRIMWMAVIIYATVDKVVIPVFDWSPAAAPYLCCLLGAVTVIYTSMGGLRAVVFTDVLQTLILFLGAILTLTVISIHLGGVQFWWPDSWPSHWPAPELGYDPNARMSLVGIALATFTWYVCTSASDQIAIQRYLATENLKSARRTVIVSTCAEGLVALLLGMVGLGLFAFYEAHPRFLTGGANPVDSGDRLFPLFVVQMLPGGIGGIVIAGLLAAAMSSLSSGLNSASSVITIDFLDRFAPLPTSEADHLKRAIVVSIFLGVVVIALSTTVGAVHGNLLEIAFKVVNLLVAPLAGLFFLAFFVPWANSIGAITGALAAFVVVVCINYWKEMTGTQGISFIWATPLGLATEMMVGMTVSYLTPQARGN